MKITGKMRWIKNINQWHLELPDDTFLELFGELNFIQNFILKVFFRKKLYNCGVVKRLFEKLDKDKPKLYTIEVEEYNAAS